MKISMTIKLYAAMALAYFFAQAAVATTEFYYTSSPQSWVGAGQTVSVTPAMGFKFNVSKNYDNGVSFSINDFSSNPDFQSTRWWYIDFAAPYNAELSVGTYEGATRWPFQTINAPGFDFSGNGRGNNKLTGSFNTLEITYAASGVPITFAADFLQYDEEIHSWWNVGSIRYNSNIPITIPEPSGTILLCVGMSMLITFSYLRRTT